MVMSFLTCGLAYLPCSCHSAPFEGKKVVPFSGSEMDPKDTLGAKGIATNGAILTEPILARYYGCLQLSPTKRQPRDLGGTR